MLNFCKKNFSLDHCSLLGSYYYACVNNLGIEGERQGKASKSTSYTQDSSFFLKEELPLVGLESTTLCSLGSALPTTDHELPRHLRFHSFAMILIYSTIAISILHRTDCR